jgi:hypothetical protein
MAFAAQHCSVGKQPEPLEIGRPWGLPELPGSLGSLGSLHRAALSCTSCNEDCPDRTEKERDLQRGVCLVTMTTSGRPERQTLVMKGH